MSGEIKHTPGPWKYDSEGMDIILSDGRVVAELSLCFVLASQREANARLIAAAPELLEAAEMALRFLDDDVRDWPNICDVEDRLRAAITKAKTTDIKQAGKAIGIEEPKH